jgi:protein glucosyltransferase
MNLNVFVFSGLGRWDLMRAKLESSSKKWPWAKKEDKAFFRGSRTSGERDNLVLLSKAKPDLVDAKFTKNQAWKSREDSLGMDPAPEVVLEDHCQFKYLFNFRGVAASFRHKHLFLCGSLVFHMGDEWNEFYYGALRPWFHFIPVPNEASSSEIEDLISFSKRFPEISREIASNGRQFVEDHLTLKDVETYWEALLKSYARLLEFKVEMPPNEKFVEIK